MRPRIEYSNKQWDNGTSRRCKVCVGNDTPVDHGSDKYGQLPAPPKTGIREAQALASRQVIWTEMLAQVEEMLGHTMTFRSRSKSTFNTNSMSAK
jgi:hypothetical protein